MKFSIALTTSSMLLAKTLATDTCPVFSVNGGCFSSMSAIDSGIEAAFCKTNSPMSCDFYNSFFTPMATVASVYYTDVSPAACFGDFDAGRFEINPYMGELGCPNIPIREGKNYGVFGAKFPITLPMQTYLRSIQMWNTPPTDDDGTVTPAYCMVMRNPACGGFAFGLTTNGDTLVALANLIPAGNPLLDNAIALIGVLMDMG